MFTFIPDLCLNAKQNSNYFNDCEVTEFVAPVSYFGASRRRDFSMAILAYFFSSRRIVSKNVPATYAKHFVRPDLA